MEAMRLKSWAPGGRPRHPVAGAAGQMSGYHRWGASHIRFPPHGEVIIPALSLSASFPSLILSLKKPVSGKALCLSEKHIL